jgi:hypothetical protein
VPDIRASHKIVLGEPQRGPLAGFRAQAVKEGGRNVAAWPPAPVSGGSSVCGFCATVRGARVDFEFAAAQLSPKMLAQRLLVDLELIGDFGLGDANGRSALDEGALFGSRLIFGWHFL